MSLPDKSRDSENPETGQRSLDEHTEFGYKECTHPEKSAQTNDVINLKPDSLELIGRLDGLA